MPPLRPPEPDADRPSRPSSERFTSAALTLICAALLLVQLAARFPPRPRAVAWSAPPLTVAVAGAVAAPGSYRLPFGATVADLVAAAGGVTPEADGSLIDLAAPLTANTTLRVPRTADPEGAPRVDVNHASERELESLPGIGPALAARIRAGRPYARVDDLLGVSGIGPATLERLRDRVTLE